MKRFDVRRQLLGLAAAASAEPRSSDTSPSAPMCRPRGQSRIWRSASTPCLRTCPSRIAPPKSRRRVWMPSSSGVGAGIRKRLARIREELGMQVVGFACHRRSAGRPRRRQADHLTAEGHAGGGAEGWRPPDHRAGGQRTEGHSSRGTARELRGGLPAAAPLCEDAGVTLSIEPLNVLVDHKGYYLATSERAFAWSKGRESLRQAALRHLPPADNRGQPDRQHHRQPRQDRPLPRGRRSRSPRAGTGEINYPNVLRAIAAKGYTGFLGLEMWPTVAPCAGHPRIDHAAGGSHGRTEVASGSKACENGAC